MSRPDADRTPHSRVPYRRPTPWIRIGLAVLLTAGVLTAVGSRAYANRHGPTDDDAAAQ
jgi:hypothetical protein